MQKTYKQTGIQTDRQEAFSVHPLTADVEHYRISFQPFGVFCRQLAWPAQPIIAADNHLGGLNENFIRMAVHCTRSECDHCRRTSKSFFPLQNAFRSNELSTCFTFGPHRARLTAYIPITASKANTLVAPHAIEWAQGNAHQYNSIHRVLQVQRWHWVYAYLILTAKHSVYRRSEIMQSKTE